MFLQNLTILTLTAMSRTGKQSPFQSHEGQRINWAVVTSLKISTSQRSSYTVNSNPNYVYNMLLSCTPDCSVLPQQLPQPTGLT